MLWYRLFLSNAPPAVRESYEATLLAFLFRFSTRDSISNLRQLFNLLRIDDGESVLSFVDKLRHWGEWISAMEEEIKAQFLISCQDAGLGELLAVGRRDTGSVWDMANYLASVENWRTASASIQRAAARGRAAAIAEGPRPRKNTGDGAGAGAKKGTGSEKGSGAGARPATAASQTTTKPATPLTETKTITTTE
jgi:hypothetical protein